MTILWCGGEDIDFPTWAGCSMGDAFGYGRASIVQGDSCKCKSTLFPGGKVTSCWISATGNWSDWNNSVFFGVGDSSTTHGGLFVGTGTNDGDFCLWSCDSSGTWAKVYQCTPQAYPSTKKIDMQIINYGATGTVNIYCNQILELTYTGNISVTGVSGFDCVLLGGYALHMNPRIAEIIVSDTDTRTMRLTTLAPTADGTTTDWTGDYTAVDEITISDADVNYTDTNAKDQQFNVSDLPAGTFYIKACKVAARACKSEDSSLGNIALGWLSGTVGVGSNQAVTTAWATYEELDTVNPVTSNAWLQAEMNDLQINVRSAT